MASSTSDKFNRLFNTKEQIRKAINRKGVRVPETLPLEQYASKIELIPFYDYNSPDAGFENFISTYYTTTASFGYQFYNNTNLQHLNNDEVGYLNRMGWQNTPSIQNAFYNCTALTTIAPMSLTSCTSAQGAFYNCQSLQELTLDITSNISNTSSMFYNCQNLTSLKLNITSSSSSMSCSEMFRNTRDLNNLSADSYINLTYPNYQSLFYNNSNITTLDFLKFCNFTSSVSAPSWHSMFNSCPNLITLELPNEFIYTPPSNLVSMFQGFQYLTSRSMPSIQTFFDTLNLSNINSMDSMFRYNYTRFANLNLNIHLPVDKQACSIASMFSSDTSNSYTERGPILYFGFNGKGSASGLFTEYSANLNAENYHPLTEVVDLEIPYVTSLASAFSYCSFLTQIQNITTGVDLKDVSNMFYNCKKLVDIPTFNTSCVTNMNGLFYGCTALTNIPILNTSLCYDFRNMFYNCTTLATIPSFDLSNISQTSGWKQAYTSSSNPLYYMFYGCSNLAVIHMQNIKSSFDISYSTKFTRDALVEIIGNLVDVGESRILHMGSTNLAKLTAEDIAVATDKGWTLN